MRSAWRERRQRRLDARLSRARMEEAATYAEWRAAAEALDALEGLDAWREDDHSDHFDGPALRAQIERLRAPRPGDSPERQADFIHEALHRHLNDVLTPDLFGRARAGTKRIVNDYLDVIEASIERLVRAEIPGWSARQKWALLKREARNLGQSALLLSGGATLGFYHVGVARALHHARLLPRVISGASMGALVAAAVCCRDDAELDALLGPELPPINRRGFAWCTPREMLQRGSLARSHQLLWNTEQNCGRYTFEEAYARSGRVLNISLAPTRRRQKPRVLNHLTAPRVWIPEAAIASAAVPWVYPPVALKQRGRDGSTRHYVADERWIDGSFGADLPTERIRRLHNVNHFIVSHAEPHALPLLHGEGGRGGRLVGGAAALARAQGLPLISAACQLASWTPLNKPLSLLHAFAAQQTRGDINIHPRFEPRLYARLLSNPTPQELRHFVREGERGAWRRLEQIRCHTQIARCLTRCIGWLEARMGGAPPHEDLEMSTP